MIGGAIKYNFDSDLGPLSRWYLAQELSKNPELAQIQVDAKFCIIKSHLEEAINKTVEFELLYGDFQFSALMGRIKYMDALEDRMNEVIEYTSLKPYFPEFIK